MEWRASLSGQIRQTYLPKWDYGASLLNALNSALSGEAKRPARNSHGAPPHPLLATNGAFSPTNPMGIAPYAPPD